ncbi:dienelactone hydrolase family protein [Streptomyces lunaelactis]|uniref:phosphoribosyltransferase family protein n=1 Tax=Streptomyces lunaelactis TaxID=1535768 RepID=UPI00158466B1|nr:phosphoribosyltransferase family protein [Streptomyces lunaelactis]NUK00302.1 dienelactone hydrolase family protein [Streptomyces lunaelactis]NUK37605.1 dienelactone hydrolase family protein [Streptomyces lunaelactis]NUK45855.1 dienelactone hydrolase family protein [Streptomyces lunaelactis]NUK94992.1 dienelactone hydrolase family protein [Streptomyces lunaelactis]NUL34346.1 dienelactone hydrolase family protein [Streptomyces lunaelactis]
MYFTDRTDAGRRLAARLNHLKGQDLVVVGLPRGGVPVAAQIAEALGAPLDVCLVRKLGVPFQPELAMGAIGEEGVRVVNEPVVRGMGVTDRDLAAVEEHERGVLEQRARRYRGERQPARYEGRTVLVVDDGLATGSTALAACRIARARGASRIVLAVPVAPHDWSARLGGEADEGVCLHTPRQFHAIGEFYADFGQTSDEEVIACLEHNRVAHATSDAPPAAGSASPEHDSLPYDRSVRIPAGGAALDGRLTVPRGAPGVVLFAHGSGSSRKSPRNRFVATGLNRAGLGTLLFDLLTEAEAVNRDNVFDTALLARRLTQATEWLREQPDTQGMEFGYFGASTGAAAALWAAAEPAADVTAVVSRGGRPDLAGPRLPEVKAPTLLIVGGRDHLVLDLNRQAAARLSCEHQLAIVPGATHLFEEPGTLESVTELATDWFSRHLA